MFLSVGVDVDAVDRHGRRPVDARYNEESHRDGEAERCCATLVEAASRCDWQRVCRRGSSAPAAAGLDAV